MLSVASASVSYSYCNKVSQTSLVSWRIQIYYLTILEVSQHDLAPLKQKCWQVFTLPGHPAEGSVSLPFLTLHSTLTPWIRAPFQLQIQQALVTSPFWFTLLFLQYHISIAGSWAPLHRAAGSPPLSRRALLSPRPAVSHTCPVIHCFCTLACGHGQGPSTLLTTLWWYAESFL